MATFFCGVPLHPLPGVNFGILLDASSISVEKLFSLFQNKTESLLDLFYEHDGLMVVRGLTGLRDKPSLLVQLSSLFGPEVENYRSTVTTSQFFHETEAEIIVLSNLPPCNFEPPPKPVSQNHKENYFPVSYPDRVGWHTDSSYRRPPPDISLLYGVKCPPKHQAQTLYANGIAAYESLDTQLKQQIANLKGVHTLRKLGRSGPEVKAGAQIKPLLTHQLPQEQPIVRRHPITGKLSLYLCDEGQMDFLSGPIAGMPPGHAREGHTLLCTLLRHLTQASNVYVHEWQEGDLVIHDNRTMPHTPTWYNSAQYSRIMWRTTAMGNPGEEYDGEEKSWIPKDKTVDTMAGLEDLKF